MESWVVICIFGMLLPSLAKTNTAAQGFQYKNNQGN